MPIRLDSVRAVSSLWSTVKGREVIKNDNDYQMAADSQMLNPRDFVADVSTGCFYHDFVPLTFADERSNDR